MKTTPTLKPCPFCGRGEQEVFGEPGPGLVMNPCGACVNCTNCAARGPPFDSERIAIAAWNHRIEVGDNWKGANSIDYSNKPN